MATQNDNMVVEHEKVLKQLEKLVEVFIASEGALRPHFILTGPSGAGKSHMIAALAEENDLNFLEINAAQLTKEGTAGNSLSKALAPLSNYQMQPTICFVDEFDKLFISGNSNSDLAHETTNGVQNEFLKVLESDSISVFGDYGKYHNISAEKVLFVFAGAFNGAENLTIDKLRDYGIKTEFLGRVGLIYNLEKLSLDSMEKILENSTILENYLELFPKVERQNVTDTIMRVLIKEHEKNTLGIRLINTLLHQYFINGGKIEEEEVKKTTFQKTLTL